MGGAQVVQHHQRARRADGEDAVRVAVKAEADGVAHLGAQVYDVKGAGGRWQAQIAKDYHPVVPRGEEHGRQVRVKVLRTPMGEKDKKDTGDIILRAENTMEAIVELAHILGKIAKLDDETIYGRHKPS